MLRDLLYFFTLSCMPVIFEVSYHVPVLLILHHVCTHDVVIGSQTMHPQLSSARLYIAQQRSAAQRSAVPCLALRFAVLCVLLNIQQQLLVVVVVPGMVQIPGLCTCFVYSSFCFFQMIVLSRSPCAPPPRQYRTYCRSQRDINKHTAQGRAISSAQAPVGITVGGPL